MGISSTVVSLAIVLGTRAAQAAGFGTPAIFCNAPYVGGKLYSLSTEGLAAMVTDGFTVNDRGYKLASTMNSAEPHAEQILVYNRAALTTCLLEFTPLKLTVGAVYNFDLTYKGVTSSISYTVTTGTVDAICDGIEALIDASLAGIAGAAVAPDSATATKLIFTGATPGEPVQISGHNPAFIKLLDTSTDAGIATDLAAAAADHSFYRFVIDTYSEAENNAAAAWAEANGNRFFAHSADTTNIADSAGTGVGQDFKTAGYNRSQVCHHNNMSSNMAAALVSRMAAFTPGTTAAHYKVLNGVSVDTLTATHISNAETKNLVIYALDDGNPHTFFGKAASGRSIRIQDALDLLDARIREAVLSVFLSNEYVPMSDKGFAMQQAAVSGVLASFQSNGTIDPGFKVNVPKAASLSASDKVAGRLTTMTFSCVMPNDMQKVVISGVVSF